MHILRLLREGARNSIFLYRIPLSDPLFLYTEYFETPADNAEIKQYSPFPRIQYCALFLQFLLTGSADPVPPHCHRSSPAGSMTVRRNRISGSC